MKTGIRLVLATAIVSGISIFMNKFGVGGMDAFVFTTAKNALVALMLIGSAYAITRLDRLKALARKQWLQLAAIGLVGGSVPFLLFFWGLQRASAASAAFIHKTMFIWVGVLAFIFLKERLNRKQAAAIGALFVGALLFFPLPQSIGIGELAIFVATLLWAVETIVSKRVLQQLDGGTVAFGRMFFGAASLLVFIAVTGRSDSLVAMSMGQWAWILLTSLLLFAYVSLWYRGLKLVDATTAASVLLVGSVITSVLSMVYGKALLPLPQLAGLGTMIVGAAALVAFVPEVGAHVPSNTR